MDRAAPGVRAICCLLSSVTIMLWTAANAVRFGGVVDERQVLSLRLSVSGCPARSVGVHLGISPRALRSVLRLTNAVMQPTMVRTPREPMTIPGSGDIAPCRPAG